MVAISTSYSLSSSQTHTLYSGDKRNVVRKVGVSDNRTVSWNFVACNKLWSVVTNNCGNIKLTYDHYTAIPKA